MDSTSPDPQPQPQLLSQQQQPHQQHHPHHHHQPQQQQHHHHHHHHNQQQQHNNQQHQQPQQQQSIKQQQLPQRQQHPHAHTPSALHQQQQAQHQPPTAQPYPPLAPQFGPPAGPYYQDAYPHPHPSAYYRPNPGPYHPHAPPAYYPPGPWAPQSTYNPTQGAQTLSNMVTTQPQPNVPQHNKSTSQLINPIGLGPVPSVHNHGLSSSAINMTNQSMGQTASNSAAITATNTTTTTTTRKKVMAVLRDPRTKEEVPLADTTTSSTKSAQNTNTNTTTTTTPSATSAPTTTTTTPFTSIASAATATLAAPTTTTKHQTNPMTTTNTASTVDHVHTLLQKVSEDNNSKISTTSKADESPKLNKIGVPTTASKTLKAANPTPAKITPAPVATTTAPVNGRGQEDNKEDVKKVDTTPINGELNSQNKHENNSAGVTEKTSLLKDMGANVAKKEDIVLENVKVDGPNEATTSVSGEQPVGPQKETSDIKQANTNSVPKENDSVANEEALKIPNEETSIPSDEADRDEEEKGDEDSKENDENKDPLSELEYEPLQYNPISNRKGKRVYSKQFLLNVCEKVCKLSVFSTKHDDKIGMDGNLLQSAFSEKIDMFAPSFAGNQRFTPTNRQNDASRRQNQHNYTGRSSAGQEKQRKIITSVSLTQEVELKTSSNPWRPAKEIKEDAPNDEVTDTETLKKRFRSILNKLTPNNFTSLAESVNELNIDTESKLGEVIDIIFAKALAEPGYCVLYGQMCSHLKKNTVGTANFGNTLLRRCQHQFNSDTYSGLNLNERKEKIDKEEDPEVKKLLNEELYEDMFRCRMRGLGLIKFIGELYKIEMLNEQIMFECVIRLLSDTSEESLECLCDLLATIGEKLDRSSQRNGSEKEKEKEKKSSKNAPKAGAYQSHRTVASVVAAGNVQQKTSDQKATGGGSGAAAAAAAAAAGPGTITTLDQVFDQMHRIRKNKDLPLPLRIRFKLLDTIDLREKDNWRSKKTKDNNPQKLEEIREQHKEKLEQERRQAQNTMGPRRSQEGGVGGGVGGGRRGLGHSGGSSNQISSMAGNESAGGRGLHTSASSHLLRDHSLGDIKSNHEEIETHKEHQRNLKSLSVLLPKSVTGGNKLSPATEALRPNSALTLRPHVRTEK